MQPKHFLDFEGRDLVASRLDDVETLTPQDAVATRFFNGDISRPKPPVVKCRSGSDRVLPIFVKDRRTPYENFPGCPRRDIEHLLIHQSYFDPRERHSDRARDTFTVCRIGQCHANLRHTVPLEQPVSTQLLPTLEYADWERCRPRHHESQLVTCLRHRGLLL